MATREEKMSDEELEELSGGVTAQTGGVKWAKKPFFAVSSGKSDFERKKLVLSAILCRDLRFPVYGNLYRAVMRIKKPFCAVSSGKSHFEGKKLVLRSIFGRDLRFPLWRNLYRAVMRIFRRVQILGLILSYKLRFPE